MSKKERMRIYTLDEVKDRALGPIGTPDRDAYEAEIQLARVGEVIREARLKRNLTQEQLGKLVGVQKAQISKLENSGANVTMATILRVFDALKAKVSFSVELSNKRIKVA
ncbi:MAG: helix-turn-helix transcriptional regulator [Flavobacteriales bacterium]|nr:helix-turn-helix transcriptional regulator [Flavobacteriales bacterium]